MSTDKLSKPVAWTWNAYGMQHATTEEDESAELILDGVDVNPLYSQEYVSALLARIADLESYVDVAALALSIADLRKYGVHDECPTSLSESIDLVLHEFGRNRAELEAKDKRIAELLAIREAKPVYFVEIEGDQDINAGRIQGKDRPDLGLLPDGINYLYTAPPAPVVPTPVNFSENSDADMCRAWAWERVKEMVTTDGWDAGDSANFFAFFCWGWDMRRQYNEQRPPAVQFEPVMICDTCGHDADHQGNRTYKCDNGHFFQMRNEPVSQGYKLPDNVREALTLALQAMEFMGDTLNNIDAVCTEDVEYVTPAFTAVRELLAAAPATAPDEIEPDSIDKFVAQVCGDLTTSNRQ